MLKNIKEKRSKRLLEFLSGSDGEWKYIENLDGTVSEYQVTDDRMKLTATFENYHSALLSWRDIEKEQLIDYENIYLKKEDYFLLGLLKEYDYAFNKSLRTGKVNQKVIPLDECIYDIYENDILIERSVPFKTVQERCAILMKMYNEEKNKVPPRKGEREITDKIRVNDLECSISFDTSDEGCEYVKWHNFYAEALDGSINAYMFQITQEEGYEPHFMIGIYNSDEEADIVEWLFLEEIIKSSEEIESIKNILIRMSDEEIEKGIDPINYILSLNEEESSITKLQEYSKHWNESIEIIDINMRKEMFNDLKSKLINEIKKKVENEIDLIARNQNYYNELKANTLKWLDNINEINNLECDNDGYSYLLKYFEKKGFNDEWIEKLDKVFEESNSKEYEDSKDDLMI